MITKSKNKTNPHQRGAAFAEFLLCLLPYMLVLLAAVFFWHLMRGRQELFNYAQAAANIGDAPDLFAQGVIKEGTAKLSPATIYSATDENTYNAKVKVDPQIDEPVLPYSTDGADFSAGISRSVYVITANMDGTINVHLSKIGRRLLAQGMIKNEVTGDNLSPTENLHFEVNTEIAADISKILNSWINYRGVDGGTYHYALHFGGNQSLGLEKSPPTESWRTTGITVGGERTFGAYSANIAKSDLRGSFNQPKLDALSDELNINLNDLQAPKTNLNYSKYVP